jgi:hypothetical protein
VTDRFYVELVCLACESSDARNASERLAKPLLLRVSAAELVTIVREIAPTIACLLCGRQLEVRSSEAKPNPR